MKYLKRFDDHADYTAYTATTSFVRPNTSVCDQEDHVHFNEYSFEYEYLTFVAIERGTFKFSGNSISYSIDSGNTWTSLASNTNSPYVDAGSTIMWKASGLTPTSSKGIGKFSSTGQFEVMGNIMSLVSGDSFSNATTIANYQFYALFKSCYYLISAKNLILPATTLANYCYHQMFFGCTSLTTAPKLPATTLANACYFQMFENCYELTEAPVLPAESMATSAYSYMFASCYSIAAAPELPATTLANYCYVSMFYDCRSIITAPELPATALTTNCYNCMFQACSGLTTIPELPAITLVSGCYSYMFSGCTSLNYIKAMFTTTPSTTYTNNWVNGVAASGTFVKNSAAQWNVTGTSGIPSGWTVQTASA